MNDTSPEIPDFLGEYLDTALRYFNGESFSGKMSVVWKVTSDLRSKTSIGPLRVVRQKMIFENILELTASHDGYSATAFRQ